jgi:hypothetical protein
MRRHAAARAITAAGVAITTGITTAAERTTPARKARTGNGAGFFRG